MIAIDLYFEFLPHWAGPMIYENLIKASKYFNFNIINYYIYPHFIRILTDLQENYEYIHIIVEKTIPNQENFLDNLSLKLKNNQEIIVDNNFYKIVKKYYCIKDFIKDIVDYSLKINTSYPKNIFWSNVGNYIAPRPFTGYGYSLKNQPTIIEGHCFPMEKYFDFSWNNLLNYEEKLHRLYQYTKEFHHLIN